VIAGNPEEKGRIWEGTPGNSTLEGSMRKSLIGVLLVLVGLGIGAWAQCGKDNRMDKKGGILITDFTITGTQTVSATEMAEITGELTGSCFNEDIDEMGERVRALFQDRGYFKVDVENVNLKAVDPLGSPKPVTMEANVDEGPRFRLNQITFLENHAFSLEQLREMFPLKTGDVFARIKVARGLESLRNLYGKQGYLDMFCIPNTSFDTGADLKITVSEGLQYQMGKLEILADKPLADRLQLAWKLNAGAVYDRTYVDKYIEENHDLLPSGFSRERVKLAKDCPDAVVDVRLTVEDKEAASREPMKDVPCEKKQDSSK
jgi:outer membrane protein assembly factor BamA